MTKSNFYSTFSLGAILIASFMCSTKVFSQNNSTTYVTVENAVEEEIYNRLEAIGTLRANESVQITANVTEAVSAIYFEDGEKVDKGKLLVEMTNSEERALLNEAQSNADEAKRQLNRIEELVSAGTASESLLDRRRRNYEAANARLLAMQSKLKDLVIKAPFSGRLGLRNISVGALVRPGDLITTLTDNAKMKLDFDVPETLLRHLDINLPVVSENHVYQGQRFSGHIVSIDNQIDPLTRTVRVRALIPNPESLLKQGMLMHVEVKHGKRNAITVSEESVTFEQGRNYVFVVSNEENGTVARKSLVDIGQRFSGRVEIIKGLSKGQQVVHHGVLKMRDKSKIRIKSTPFEQVSL